MDLELKELEAEDMTFVRKRGLTELQIKYDHLKAERDRLAAENQEPENAVLTMDEQNAELVSALEEIKRWTGTFCAANHPIITFADKALAKVKESA